jgi:GPH family glycoside/pentoside/hexuronide:cation symporter
MSEGKRPDSRRGKRKHASPGVSIPFFFVLGLVTILGGIYALGRLFDAITDPWIANLSDKSTNPKGRRLPFMRKAAIPLALATVLVYWTPLNQTSPLNGIWVMVMMLLFYLFMTVYCTPYNALIAALSGT